MRHAYREALTAPPSKVAVDLGAGPLPVDADEYRMQAGAATGPVRWSTLDTLPLLTEIDWSGPDRGCARRWPNAHWSTASPGGTRPAIVDLTGTNLDDLTLIGTGV